MTRTSRSEAAMQVTAFNTPHDLHGASAWANVAGEMIAE
jgi:hypothetical protein